MEQPRIEKPLNAIMSNAAREKQCALPTSCNHLINYVSEKLSKFRIPTDRCSLVLIVPISGCRTDMVHRNTLTEGLHRHLCGEVQRIARNPFHRTNKFLKDRVLGKCSLDELVRRSKLRYVLF